MQYFLSLLTLQNLPFMKSLLSCYFLTEFLVFLLWIYMLILLNSGYTSVSVLLCTSIFFQPTACPKVALRRLAVLNFRAHVHISLQWSVLTVKLIVL